MSRMLFPKISPYTCQWLQVDATHEIYIEQSGNQQGIPVVYLHGGPGAGASEDYRRYFCPEKYRIILIDQRGCGRSKPSPSLVNNTMWDLVNDLEKIRTHLGIEKWLVAGGSWGTTLALTYSVSYPDKVMALILRGIFLGTQQEIDWLYQPHGVAKFYPEYFQEFIQTVKNEYKNSVLQSYYHLLTSNNELAVTAASQSWYLWELRLSSLEYHQLDKRHIVDKHQALCMAKISAHYFVNRCYLSQNYLLDNIERISAVPAIIIHGRYDMVCQLDAAYQLSKRWKNAQLQILPSAGHSGFEQQTIEAFCNATERMAEFIEEQLK